ncbi:unnamed protein product [Polarella glacialis]|uniref:Uncharacterized protein n=1 Tax=Polarella glacialis TaxID=89957 RepID=A0A813JRP5_POLGL|nr:unnamed protein product [Polarella glacialis]CAE8681343.1 unnamed protein product [Polarella glacialis]
MTICLICQDLQLPLLPFGTSKASVETFGALLGVMRASNPRFPQRKASRTLKVRCPLTERFPTTFTGILVHYDDVDVSVREIIDKGGPRMDVHKMWRLVPWIFLGNGGFMHQPWKALRDTSCDKSYRTDMRQPLEVLR